MAQRPPLSLTAELEKLEQSITLTMQEIDHNFARAHRIVTSSILPVVERYGRESDTVWEGSKFWKQFFEASANVALSNYQEDETIYDDQTQTEATQQTYREESTFPASSPGNYTERPGDFTQGEHTGHPEQPPADNSDDDLLDDSLLESLNLTGAATQSTPKGKQPQQKTPHTDQARWAEVDSPFDALKNELTTKDYGYSPDPEAPATVHNRAMNETEDSILPSTPHTVRRAQGQGLGLSDYPNSSRRTPGTAHEDHILHRVLDKNWRLQATPLGKPPPSRYRTVAATPKAQLFTNDNFDSSPSSSPVAPELYTTFFSPAAAVKTPKRQAAVAIGVTPSPHKNDFDFEEEDSDDLILPPGFSPPKTIQFSLPPSKLLATPAREASRRIVYDILQTAGASVDESRTTVDSSPPGKGLDEDDPFGEDL